MGVGYACDDYTDHDNVMDIQATSDDNPGDDNDGSGDNKGDDDDILNYDHEGTDNVTLMLKKV